MPLVPKVAVVQALTGGIVVTDSTGMYDPIANPGGWGAPNQSKSAVVGILLSSTPLAASESGVKRLSAQDLINYMYQGGAVAPQAMSTIPDGVYVENARIGFGGPTVVSAQSGSLQFNMTGANTVFATADGFTVDAIDPTVYYQIDRTRPLTPTGGWVTTPLANISGQSSVVYTLCTVNALVYEAGFACLNRDIADIAGTCDCCSGEDINDLLSRYGEYLAMGNKFNLYGDYAGANFLAKKLQNDCQKRQGACVPQSLQSNVPFTGNAPMIALQPVDVNVAIGGQASFAVAATGTQPLSYQWYQNGVILPGQVGSTLILSNLTTPQSSTLYVIVSNAYGSAQSDTVNLVVGSTTTPVTITQQPTNQSGQIGGNVTFTTQAAGTQPITYQWYKGGVPISGATSNVLNLTNIQQADIVQYYCIVTGPTNNVQSSTVTISLGVAVGWGWTNNAVPLLSDVQNAQGAGTIISGNPLVADFRANATPLVLFAFEPTSEPAKTKWYGSVNNNGNIGDPNNDIFVVTIITGGYRVYYTVFPTVQTETVLQFLTASQTPS